MKYLKLPKHEICSLRTVDMFIDFTLLNTDLTELARQVLTDPTLPDKRVIIILAVFSEYSTSLIPPSFNSFFTILLRSFYLARHTTLLPAGWGWSVALQTEITAAKKHTLLQEIFATR